MKWSSPKFDKQSLLFDAVTEDWCRASRCAGLDAAALIRNIDEADSGLKFIPHVNWSTSPVYLSHSLDCVGLERKWLLLFIYTTDVTVTNGPVVVNGSLKRREPSPLVIPAPWFQCCPKSTSSYMTKKQQHSDAVRNKTAIKYQRSVRSNVLKRQHWCSRTHLTLSITAWNSLFNSLNQLLCFVFVIRICQICFIYRRHHLLLIIIMLFYSWQRVDSFGRVSLTNYVN